MVHNVIVWKDDSPFIVNLNIVTATEMNNCCKCL